MRIKTPNKPQVFEQFYGGYQYNYNIKEIKEVYGEEVMTFYEYDTIRKFEELTLDNIVISIMREKYSLEEELAMIHNWAFTGFKSLEYNDYLRERAQIVDQVTRDIAMIQTT